MLTIIQSANAIAEIAGFPGWKLHPLKGDLKGYWSLTVTRNYRLVFRFENGNASALDFMDYH